MNDREGKEQHNSTDSEKKTGCVIMASGLGRRFGANKLLADLQGEPMISRIIKTARPLFDQVVVVTRYEAVADLAVSLGVQALVHDLPGRNDTIRLGLSALEDVDYCVFCPGDQPLISRETLAGMISAAGEDTILRACCQEQTGMPVLFSRRYFEELKSLPDSCGGNVIIKKYPEKVGYIPVRDVWELQDVDCPEDLNKIQSHI